MIQRPRMLSFVVLCLVLTLWGAVNAAQSSLRVQLILGARAIKYLNDNVIPEFEREFNTGVDIETVDWNNRMEKLLITTAAGVPPDVYMSGAEHVLELVENGLIAPLDREFSQWADRRDFLAPTFGSSIWEGVHYGVPIYTAPRVWWYRADLFEDAGMSGDQPPRSWSELLDAAKRLTKTDGQQVIRQGYDLSRWTGTASPFGKLHDFAVYLWQIGGELFDDEYQPLFTSPESIATMEFLFQLKEAVKPPGYQVVVPGGGGEALIKGAAVINLAGGWISSQVHQYAPDQLDVVKAIVPVPGEKNRVTNIFSDWLGIHAQSTNKELAWEFIKAVTQPEVLVDMNAELGLLSPRRSTITEFLRRRPLSKYMYETVEYARPYPVFPLSVQLSEAWSSQYTLAIEGQLGIVPAMEEASRRWRVILQEWSGAQQ